MTYSIFELLDRTLRCIVHTFGLLDLSLILDLSKFIFYSLHVMLCFTLKKKGSCNISVLWTVTLTQYEATTPGLTSVYLGSCAMPSVLINLDHGDLKVVVDPLFIIIRLILILYRLLLIYLLSYC